MRKLLGGLATLTAPVVAMTMFTGSQPQGPGATQSAGAGVGTAGEQAIAAAFAPGEKADLADAAAQVAELCGLKCGSFAKGEASVTGLGSIDAFFDAVLSIQTKAGALEGEIKVTLAQMAAIIGVEVDASADVETMAGVVASGFAEFRAGIDGDIALQFTPPKCSVSVDATLQAKAKCEGEVKPGKVAVECKGECVADASVMGASCEGELSCSGTAPSFACEGSCEGQCELSAGGTCEGSCQGSCELDGTAKCDGECKGDTDAGGNCNGECEVRAGGTCSGTCTGSCELKAGASCSGQCKGECTYDPGTATCNGELTCTPPSATASVMCKGECKGEVEPPMVKAECEASVKAKADLSAECTPPSIGLSYNLKPDFEFNGGADVDAQVAFNAKLEAFIDAYGELLGKKAQLEGILRASGGLVDAGASAIGSAADTLVGNADFSVQFKVATCLPSALDAAGDMLTAASAKVEGSIGAVATIAGGING